MLNIDFLKNHHQMIHFFGLGFVQLKIDNNLRIHFYHPDLKPIVPDEEVHNHRYDFISTILAGQLKQDLFEVKPGQSDFYMIEENCKENKLIEPEKIPVILTPVSSQIFLKGDSYTSLTTEFHTVSTDFAITRLYRGNIKTDNALIVKNHHSVPVCPFSKKLTTEECWDIVNDCIKLGQIQQMENSM